MPKPEIYISVDIEADGPLPGPNSMLSLGAAAFVLEEKEGELAPRLVDTWTANLQQIEGSKMDPNTQVFWNKNPKAWAECRKEPLLRADLGMESFAKWVTSFKKQNGYRPVFVGAPAGFDFTYVYWYLIRFYGSSPFSFSALDMKTYVSAVMDLPYHDSGKRSYPKRWFTKLPHTHVALDDAIEQGYLFCNMLKERKENPDIGRIKK
jgi:hypothetical protein